MRKLPGQPAAPRADNGPMTTNVAARDELSTRTAWAVGRVAQLVHLGRGAGWLPGIPVDAPSSFAVLETAKESLRFDSPMSTLAERLGLSSECVDALWLLVCMELDPHVSATARALLGPGMHELSAQIVERLVGRGTVPDADLLEPLAELCLIEMEPDAHVPLYRRAVRAHDRVLDVVKGRFELDRSMRNLATLHSAIDVRRDHRDLHVDVPEALSSAVSRAGASFVVVSGAEGSGRSTLVKHVISSSGRSVIAIRAQLLAEKESDLTKQIRALHRECRLHDAWPLVLECEALGDRLRIVDRELATYSGPVFATARTSASVGSRATITLRREPPTAADRAAMWKSALPSAPTDLVRECAARYSIAPGLIAASCRALASTSGAIEMRTVHEALRPAIERQVGDLARRIETRQTWNDLVLPTDQLDTLIELVARVQHRERVLDDWGFADKVGRGTGVAALLSGPPGTGKTMIAGLVARELGLDLYQVDLSKIISKYIGETEKQLAALFDAAESGHAILLFDEADSIFGKRTEVKSSNDRYANLAVNYLLQRIEAFTGITLLTTNHETAIDPAFMRRLAFHVRVPMPDEQQREKLWRAMLPAAAEFEADLDVVGLAEDFEMAGGYIRNAVLRAAFMGASEGTRITNAHMSRAARAEYETMGKIAYQSRPPERTEPAR
jgi:hypothetical protein